MCAGKQSARPHTDNCTLTHSRTRRPRTSHPSLSSKLLQPCLQELETSPNTIVVFFFGKCEQLPGDNPKLPVDRMLGTCADLGRARGAEQAGR